MQLQLTVVEIVVADMQASIDFYSQLGLTFPEDAAAQPHVEAEVGNGIRLALDTVAVIESMDPNWTQPTGGHRMALAFACNSPGEVDAAYAALTAQGAHGHIAPFDAPWQMRYAVVEDPDGNPVDLFATL